MSENLPDRLGEVLENSAMVPFEGDLAAEVEPNIPDDVRALAMSQPVPKMLAILQEGKDRRVAFRDWVKSQMKRGVHYGYPPGCEPQFDDNGNVLIYMKGGLKPYPKEQWTPKESLYAAGADFICDLLRLRDAYGADMDGWKQLGEPKGTFVYFCNLYSHSTGVLISEGRGAAKVGEKRRDENASIKIAKKCAKVDAVLNAYGLRDLFTQDLENVPQQGPEQHANPPRDDAAPKAKTRAERKEPPVTKEDVGALIAEFGTFNERHDVDAKQAFTEFVASATGLNFDVGKLSQWSPQSVRLVREAIAKQTGGEPPEAVTA